MGVVVAPRGESGANGRARHPHPDAARADQPVAVEAEHGERERPDQTAAVFPDALDACGRPLEKTQRVCGGVRDGDRLGVRVQHGDRGGDGRHQVHQVRHDRATGGGDGRDRLGGAPARGEILRQRPGPRRDDLDGERGRVLGDHPDLRATGGLGHRRGGPSEDETDGCETRHGVRACQTLQAVRGVCRTFLHSRSTYLYTPVGGLIEKIDPPAGAEQGAASCPRRVRRAPRLGVPRGG